MTPQFLEYSIGMEVGSNVQINKCFHALLGVLG